MNKNTIIIAFISIVIGAILSSFYFAKKCDISTNISKETSDLKFDTNLNALSYILPAHTTICTPETMYYCTNNGCERQKPKVFLLYDKNTHKVYRCDNKPCDGYDIALSLSGDYLNMTPITPNGSLIKISPENNYIETVSLGLDFLIYRGKCITNK